MEFSKKLGRTDKQFLLAYFDYSSIYDAKKQLNIKTADDIYSKLVKDYKKEKLEEEKKQIKKIKEKSIKKAQEEAKQILEKIKTKTKNKEQKFYKKNVVVFDHKKYGINWSKELYKLLKTFKGQKVHIDIINRKLVDKEDKSVVVDIDEKFSNWWKKEGRNIFYDNSEEAYFNPNDFSLDLVMEYEDMDDAVKVCIYDADKNITPKKVKQYFKEGETNCLLTPIMKWAIDCRENSKSDSSKKRYNAVINKVKKYEIEIQEQGVDENKIQEIVNDLQIDITINKPLCDIKYIEAKSNKKSLKHFKYVNTRLHHVQLENDDDDEGISAGTDFIINNNENNKKVFKDNFTYQNNYIEVNRNELLKIKKELDNNGSFYTFKQDLINVSSINTINGTYKLPSEFRDVCNQFEIETGLINCKIDDITDYDLSQFVKRGTHYNSTIDFNEDRINIKHADMETAYTQYKLCSVYEGFLGKITDFRPTNKIEGVGLYLINNLKFPDNELKKYNDKMRIFENNNVYTSAELAFLNNNNVKFNILLGCWGVEPLDIEIDNYDGLMKKYDGVRGYAKYVGSCDSHKLKDSYYINGDEEYAGELRLNTTGEIKYCYGKKIIEISYDKKHNYHLGHFTAFILAYQRLNVLEQLLKMDINNIVRVCVDGIYYRGNYELSNSFRPKEEHKFGNEPDTKYISNLYKKFDMNISSLEREHNNKELHIGEGGNGKTHKNLMDKGLIKLLYIAPSWKLSTKKALEYGVKSNVLANVLSTDPEKINIIKKYNVLLLDEVSMMEECQKQYIFNTYSDMKLIFCGDIGFQAPPFNSEGKPVIEITREGFDKIIKYKENYRFKCDLLKLLVKQLRQSIKLGDPNKLVNEYVIEQLGTIKNEEMNYKINDMILTRTHNIKDVYTEKYKDMNKWYVTKNTREYKNGEIVIGNKPNTTCEIRHAYTIHSIQGETAENKLFINMDVVYDKRILYTAISRAKTLNQIVLVKN